MTTVAKITGVIFFVLAVIACGRREGTSPSVQSDPVEELRARYERPPEEWPAPNLDSGVVHRELGVLERNQLIPSTDPLVDSVVDERALVQLGKQLFFDPRLSASNQISCASCHDPDLAWGDGRRRSFGHNRSRGKRNAPSLLNAGHWTRLFWDGRAASLEAQVFGPLRDHLEMRQELASLGDELTAISAYRNAFSAAFGRPTVDTNRVAFAIAAFERTIRSRTSRFDHFVNGRYDALSDEEVLGLDLFRGKARCLNCHNGPLFSDQQFHNQGSHLLGRPEQDLGRYLVTGNWADAGKFRTPMLRDVAFTGPYFHHGNIVELREIIQMYSVGMPQVVSRNVRNTAERIPLHSPLLQRLDLTEEETDQLLAFLQSISVRPRAVRVPEQMR